MCRDQERGGAGSAAHRSTRPDGPLNCCGKHACGHSADLSRWLPVALVSYPHKHAWRYQGVCGAVGRGMCRGSASRRWAAGGPLLQRHMPRAVSFLNTGCLLRTGMVHSVGTGAPTGPRFFL